MKGNVTNTGYWPDSPDRNNDFNIIPSNNITMEGMDMPLMGISNTGDKKLMLPGKNYKFKGESVMETPINKGIFLGAYKQVGGQLVPYDTNMSSFQKGGEPIYVYSKDDPAYKKYLRDLEYYNKQKAIYDDSGERAAYQTYDDLVEQAYKNAEHYKEKFDPSIGLEYVHIGQPNSIGFAFRKPSPVILEKESNPEAIDIKPLPIQQVDLKSALTRLPIPQTNKQRVVVNTPQGDKIRVQDAKTKRFINWEDEKGLPSDIENPSGTASQDFPEMRRVAVPPGGFAYGGDISIPNLSRQDGGGLEGIFKQIVPSYGTQPSLIQEVASMPAEVSHIVKSRSYEPSEAYIQELMRQENEGNTGFRNNRYYPYDSVEGGTPTIGYGHKLTEKEVNSNKYAAGLTKADVEKLMRDDLHKHKDVARSAFENEYGKGTFNRLPDSLKDLVVDYSYTGTGIDKFPNFHKAVYEYSATKDPALKQAAYDKMLAQYKRHTGKKELKKRNAYTEQVLRGLKQEGGATYDIPNEYYRAPNVVREEGREWYDPVSETIHMQPDYPNFTYEQLVKNHELEHHKQKLRGALSSTEYWPGPLKEPAVGASDEMIYPYYNRAGQDVRNLMNAAPQSTFFGIPEDIAVMGFQNKTYDVPGTAEYEAEYPNTPRTLYRGKPVAKNAIAKTLSREEKDPEMMFRDKYNTELTKEEQKEFDKWAKEESKKQGRDILMDKGAYDVQGFWKSGDWKNRDADNHGTDTWKKPNHPTFSNQSKYHGAGGWYGGNWTEDAGYQPSKQTLNNYGPDYYNWMFGEEPNRPEHLDMSRYDGTNLPIPIVYQKGGSVKKVRIKSLPKNWKTQ